MTNFIQRAQTLMGPRWHTAEGSFESTFTKIDPQPGVTGWQCVVRLNRRVYVIIECITHPHSPHAAKTSEECLWRCRHNLLDWMPKR